MGGRNKLGFCSLQSKPTLSFFPGESTAVRCWSPMIFHSQRLFHFVLPPSTEFPLPGREFSFEYPIDEEESDFNRGFLSFIDTTEELVAKVVMGNQTVIYSIKVLCAAVVTLSTATKPYAYEKKKKKKKENCFDNSAHNFVTG